jgi:hypothetical protein
MASLETEAEDPEDLLYDRKTGNVTGTVRVVRRSACCGDDMTEATFDIDAHADADPKGKPTDEYEVEVESIEATESGGGRYAKNMVGFELHGKVTRTRKGKSVVVAEFDASDDMAASHFDDLN